METKTKSLVLSKLGSVMRVLSYVLFVVLLTGLTESSGLVIGAMTTLFILGTLLTALNLQDS